MYFLLMLFIATLKYLPVWTTDPITDGGGEGEGTPGGVVSGILPAIGGKPIASTDRLNKMKIIMITTLVIKFNLMKNERVLTISNIFTHLSP